MLQENAPYSVAVEDDNFIVRLDRRLFDQAEITRFLDYLRIESFRKRSQATPDEIEQLAQDVKRSIWERLKPQFLDEE